MSADADIVVPLGLAVPAGLYVHVPFCSGKCRYCDFYSISPDSALVAGWLNAVRNEAALFRDVFPWFDTFYLGGGTPSLLSPGQLESLLENVRGSFRFASDAEITLEANPDDVTERMLEAWHALGINRISLGVQSLDDQQLAWLGRRHTAAQALEAMESIRCRGAFSLSVDLMCGLPEQGPLEWLRTLEEVVAFEPSHLSCYQLTPAEGTPLWRDKDQGLVSLPGELLERHLFMEGSRFLEARGYFHYEVSNFAKKATGRTPEPAAQDPFVASTVCRHNMKYWLRAPYLGLGPSAHSFLGEARWWNVRSVERYCAALEQGLRPKEGRETLTKEQADLERLFLMLRIRRGMGEEILDAFPNARDLLPRLLRDGYLEIVGGRVVPTIRGFLFADRLPLLFE